MSDTPNFFKSVIDRRRKEIVVEGKTISIVEPSAKKARQFFALQSENALHAVTNHGELQGIYKRIDSISTEDPEYHTKTSSLRAQAEKLLGSVITALAVVDTKPILLMLGDQITEEWLEEEIGLSQLQAISEAINEVMDRKNLMGAVAPSPQPEVPVVAETRTVTQLFPPQ